MKSARLDKNMSYDMINYMFNHGQYLPEDVMWYVDNGNITKEQFHFITGYDYNGLKSSLEEEQQNKR